MLARPKAWFSNDWLLTDDDGREVLLDQSVWRETASFELDEALSTSINMDAFEPMVLAAKEA